MNKNSFLYTVIFVFIVAFVLVVPLALANDATKGLVEDNKKFAQGKAILGALGVDISSKSKAEVLDAYKGLERYSFTDKKLTKVDPANAAERDKSENLLYFTTVNGVERVAQKARGNGLWASITVVIGYELSTDTFAGLTILEQIETPGLGGRIEEQWFLDQFKGEAAAKPLSMSLIGTGKGDAKKDNSMFDSISGATLTSGFTRDIVNKGIKLLKEELAGGKQ